MSLYERYVTTFFQQKGRHPSSLSEVQRNALQSLRDDSAIVISKPDKGNGIVIMNKSDYFSKMLPILNDKTKFSRVKSDNNLLCMVAQPKSKTNKCAKKKKRKCSYYVCTPYSSPLTFNPQ